MLHRLGGPNGVIRQTEFFLYSDKDKRGRSTLSGARLRVPGGDRLDPRRRSGLQAREGDGASRRPAFSPRAPTTTSSSSSSANARAGAWTSYLDVVKAALDAGVRVRCHLEDITRADFYGFVLPFVPELMRLAQESGIPIKIRLCDTMGFGVPYPGAALPRSVPKLVQALRHECGVPPSSSSGTATTTSTRCTSTPRRRGSTAARRQRHAARLRRAHRQPAARRPGDRVHRPQGARERHGHDGHHRDGRVLRARDRLPHSRATTRSSGATSTSPAPASTPTACSRTRRSTTSSTRRRCWAVRRASLIDKTSGTAGVAWWINAYFHFQGEHRVDKKAEPVRRITEWIDVQYHWRSYHGNL